MVGSAQLRVSTGGQVNTLKSIALEAAWSHTEARRHGGTERDFLTAEGAPFDRLRAGRDFNHEGHKGWGTFLSLRRILGSEQMTGNFQ